MAPRAALFFVALALVSAVSAFPDSHGKGRETSARAAQPVDSVKIAFADTKADSDSKAMDGMASSSSSTKGSAIFVSKYPHDYNDHDSHEDAHHRFARSAEFMKIALADTKAESDNKAKDGMAHSSSSTKGTAVFVAKYPHRRSARSPAESVNIALADSNGHSDSVAKVGMAHSSSLADASAAFVAKYPHHGKDEHHPHHEDHHQHVEDHPHKEDYHGEPSHHEKDDHHHDEYQPHHPHMEENLHDHDKEHHHWGKTKERSHDQPLIDLQPLKKKIAKLVADSVDV